MGTTHRHPAPGEDWSVPSPPQGEVWRDILEPAPRLPVQGVVVSRRTVGLYHHWVPRPGHPRGPCSRPCIAQWTACPCCAQRMGTQWAAYVCIQPRLRQGLAVARLSLGAVRSCPALEPGSGAPIRGKGLIVKRAGNNLNSLCLAELVEPPDDLGVIPAEIDLIAWLCWMWGMPDPRQKEV